ncbi:MAG TPA: carbohydrate ABC transporter permease [Candidatus Limiplasma sp.]|nr:carbohydrate ABC transporter permease [Candidatus Limiplasma sp.]
MNISQTGRQGSRFAKRRTSRGDRAFEAVAVGIVTLLTLLILLPMINVVSASFSSASAVNAGRVLLLPVESTLENYKTILKYNSVWLGYRNTIFYTVVGTFINVSLTMMCAYPLAQKSFSGRKFLSILFFIPMIFNGGMIPNYILMRDLKIINTLWAGLIPGAINIFNMIVTRTFIQSSIPDTMAEAARIDGCSPTRYFFSFVLPLSKTIIAVISMYYAVSHWNDYFTAFLYINKRSLYPLQLFLREILVNSQFDSSVMNDPDAARQLQGLAETLKYVVIVVSTLPLMCIYPFVQKYFVKGVMIGSVKG